MTEFKGIIDMRNMLTLLLVTSTIGCSSSSDPVETDNGLVGTWLSNCHEFLNTENEAGDNRYAISELTINETEYVDNYTSFSDTSCTTDPVQEASSFTYIVGDMIDTTDGVEATRISLTAVLDRPNVSLTVEGIYRVSGVELNFGEYTEGEIPSIDTTVTFIKQ